MAKKKGGDKYLFVLFVILVIVFSYIIIKPFISAILTGIILSYIFYPLFKMLNKFIKNKNLCSLLLCTFIIAITLLPMVFVGNALIREAFNLYNEAKSSDIDLDLPGPFQENFFEQNIRDMISKGSLYVIDSLSDFVLSIPRRILDLFIVMFLMFYLFKDGPEILRKVKQLLPFDRKTGDMVTKEFADITFAVVYGLVATAIVQGIVGGIGFYIFKIPNPILWGTVMALIAIIPFLGPFLVWLPIGLFQLFYGNKFSGIGILLFGTFVISTVDNVIRPKIIGSRARIHPVVALIGVVGGIKLLGFIGVVAGPLILALLISFIDRYRVSRIAAKG